MEKILSNIYNEAVRIEASGRTDAGVHALGQVIAFTKKSSLTLSQINKSLISLFPKDIGLRKIGYVPPNFHPRFDCYAKKYRYYLRPHADTSIFSQKYFWSVKEHLNNKLFETALKQIIGRYDFKIFSSKLGTKKQSTIRQITKADLNCENPIWEIKITGNGFLRHTIRNIVGTCVQIGKGQLKSNMIHKMLKTKKRSHSGLKAPAKGLYLSQIYYA